MEIAEFLTVEQRNAAYCLRMEEAIKSETAPPADPDMVVAQGVVLLAGLGYDKFTSIDVHAGYAKPKADAEPFNGSLSQAMGDGEFSDESCAQNFIDWAAVELPSYNSDWLIPIANG